MNKITVFTPTYNRAYIIENLYRSLQRQTFTDFEWLVVDDGSVDNTEDIFSTWQKEENAFPIRYYKKENGGKCRAINYALDLADGELFFTVDSDDYLTDDALEKIVKWESDLSNDGKYCGVAGNLGISKTSIPNKILPNEYHEGTLLDRYNVIDGERALAFYTEVHRQYKYPEFEGEKFMTEAVVYNRMAHDGYKMRFYNDIIWIYEYKEDGLTKAGNKLFLNNPRGYCLWLKEKIKFEGGGRKAILKYYYSMTCELSGLYSKKQISNFAGTSILVVFMCSILHKLLTIFRRK